MQQHNTHKSHTHNNVNVRWYLDLNKVCFLPRRLLGVSRLVEVCDVQLGQHVVVPVVRHFEEETVAQVERELLKERVVCVCVCVRAGKGKRRM